MFGIPRPTPLDLDFALFGVPVRVSAWHWLGAGFFGWGIAAAGADGAGGGTLVAHLVIAVLCIFGSILLHEMGHALTARVFGMDWAIVLLLLGGLAYGRRPPSLKWWQDVLIVLAGPAVQLALAGALLLSEVLADTLAGGVQPESALAHTAWVTLLFVNIVWPVLNLLPIFPLDGGQALRAILGRFLRSGAEVWTARVGFFAAVMIGALLYVKLDDLYAAVLFGFLAMQNYQAMQALGRR